MNVTIREYREKDIPEMIKIWNDVINGGTTFAQIQ